MKEKKKLDDLKKKSFDPQVMVLVRGGADPDNQATNCVLSCPQQPACFITSCGSC